MMTTSGPDLPGELAYLMTASSTHQKRRKALFLKLTPHIGTDVVKRTADFDAVSYWPE